MRNKKDRKLRKTRQKMISIFYAVLLLPTVVWLFICAVGLVFPGIKNTLDYDLGEKRRAAEFPVSFSGDYFTRLEEYYNDHMPFRSILVSVGDACEYAVEKPYESGIKNLLLQAFHSETETKAQRETETAYDLAELFGTTGEALESTEEASFETVITVSTDKETESAYAASEEVVADTTEAYEEETASEPVYPTAPTDAVDTDSYYPPVVRNDYVIVGRGDWLFMYGSGNINYYLGNNIMDESSMANYLETLEKLYEACSAKGKKLAIIVPPNKDSVYSEYMPSYEIENEYKRVPRLVDYIQANSAVPIAFPINEIKAAKQYFLTYMKYDSHWNEAGAFIGTQVVLKLLGMDTTNILSLSVTPQIGTGGDLIASGSLNIADYQTDYSYLIDYKPEINAYYVEGNMSSDQELFRLKTNSANPEKLALIGDSYRNHMVLYLYKEFAETTSIHVYLKETEEAKQYIMDSDVVVLCYVERNDGFLLSTAQYLTELLNSY